MIWHPSFAGCWICLPDFRMPAISVVIPVYNAAPFLREALDSLLAQTCGDFEAIAVNDGSTDNSLEILQEYAARDSRIRILDGPNGGYGKAMNRGMDAATGKYMAILEPDDYLPREAYAILLEMAEKHQLDVARGTYCAFYEDEAGIRRFSYVIPIRRPDEVFCPWSELPGEFESGSHIWTGLYRLPFLRERGIRFHETPGASYQDTGFFFLCATHAERYMLTDEVTYLYRTNNPGSSINNVGQKRYALLEEYAHIRRMLEGTTKLWPVLEQQYYVNRFAGVIWVVSSLPESERESFVDNLKRILPDWNVPSIPSHYRAQLESCLRPADAAAGGSEESCRCIAGGLVRICMSAAQTSLQILGVPVLRRKRVRVLRQFRSGISAESDLADVWYFMGVRVHRRMRTRYAGWPVSPSVPAQIC